MAYGRPTMTSHLARVPLPGSLDITSCGQSDSPSLIAFYTSTIQLYSILDGILSDVYKNWHGRSNETTPETRHAGLDVIIRLEDQLLEFESSIPSFLSWTATSSLPPKSVIEETISRQRNVLHSRWVSCAIEMAFTDNQDSFITSSFSIGPCSRDFVSTNNLTRPSTAHQRLIRYCYANGLRGVSGQQQTLFLSSMRHMSHRRRIRGGIMASVSVALTCDVIFSNSYRIIDTSTAAMILIMSYSCYQASEIDLPTIDTTWRKAETVLQHLGSFSVSGRNTLNFLQTMRLRFVSHLKVHLPATGNGNASPSPVSAERGLEDLSQPVMSPWQPLSWDEGLSTNELGFLGPFDISEMQSWFPHAGIL